MKRFAFIAALVLAAAELGALGCNAILGNEEGKLLADASTVSCAAGEKACGACVKTDDPKVGCGGDCTVCPTPLNGQSACVLQNSVETCALGACNPQFGNCDNSAANGCETHTTTKDNCGSCGHTCAPQPFCEPSTTDPSGYACSDTCLAPFLQCNTPTGIECTDPKTDNNNCGACNKSCTVANGTGTCNDGNCDIVCKPNFFLCGGKCVAPDNNACGAGCGPCGAGTTCDTTAGDQHYGNCVLTGAVDAGCANVVCNGVCCDVNDVCCGNQCTTSGNSACGATCEACGAGSTCGTALAQCKCDNAADVPCTNTMISPPSFWCCGSGTTCGLANGTCNTANCGPFPRCTLPSTTACGCSDGVSCNPPTKPAACGANCQSCGATGCCCPGFADGGTSYSCQSGTMSGPDGGVTCGPGCNP